MLRASSQSLCTEAALCCSMCYGMLLAVHLTWTPCEQHRLVIAVELHLNQLMTTIFANMRLPSSQLAVRAGRVPVAVTTTRLAWLATAASSKVLDE